MLPTALQRHFEDIYPSAIVAVNETQHEGIVNLKIRLQGKGIGILPVNLRTISQDKLIELEENINEAFMEKCITPYD